MTVPKWEDSYRIGLPVFDNEHKILLDKIESLFLAIEAGECEREVILLIDEWVDLYLRHIAWEERWMMQLSTPAGAEHRRRHKEGHRELTARATLLRDRLLAGADCRAALEDIGFFLTMSELIQHDFELVGFLRREGVLTGANEANLCGVMTGVQASGGLSEGERCSTTEPPKPIESAGPPPRPA